MIVIIRMVATFVLLAFSSGEPQGAALFRIYSGPLPRLVLGRARGGRTSAVRAYGGIATQGEPSFRAGARWVGLIVGELDQGRPAVLDLRTGRVIPFAGSGHCLHVDVSPDGRAMVASYVASGPGTAPHSDLLRLPDGARIATTEGAKAAFWIDGGRRALWVEDRLDGRPLTSALIPPDPEPSRTARGYRLMDARTGVSHPLSIEAAGRAAPVIVRALERHRFLTGGLYVAGQAGLYVSPDGQAALVSVNRAMRRGNAPDVTELLLPRGGVRTVLGYERGIRTIGWQGHRPVGYDGYGDAFGIGVVSETDGRYRRYRTMGDRPWSAFAG